MIEKKLDGKSSDIISENVKKLKQLFPEIVSEDQINFNMLEVILTGGGNCTNNGYNERYQFTWSGKSEAIKESQKSSNGTLIPCKEKSKNWETTENIFIEGDNLEVLKLLQKSYYNKIKMIYIDPPYNTGKDFLYSDNYKDNLQNYIQKDKNGFKLSSNPETNGRFHTKWLNMMYPRLRLARNLLTDYGVIFINIDDNEIENLKKICNEIFGEENFICILPRITKKSGKSSEAIAKNNDYILVYSKTQNPLFYPFIHTDINFKHIDKYVKDRGKYKLNQPLDYNTLGYVSSLDYPIKINEDTYFPGNVSENEYIKRKKENPKDGFRWRWSRKLFDFGLKNEFIEIKKYEDYSRIYTKTYENASIKKDSNGEYYIEYSKRTKPLSTLYFTSNEFSNDNSKKDINKILKNNVFNYSKPNNLIKKIIEFSCCNNDIILDFFAGSSTTAQSVLEFNNIKKSNCKFIMIQIPEIVDEKSEAFKLGYKNICDISRDRIDISGDKIIGERGNEDLDIGFKVFKLDSSNLTKWNPDINNLEDSLVSNANNIIPNRSESDLVYEIMLKYGIDLTVPVEEIRINNKKIYSVSYGALLICLDDNLNMNIAEDIIKIKKDLDSDVIRVLFKDNGFKSDSDKTNVKETLRANNIDEFITI